MADADRPPRRYDNTRRSEAAAGTRERIVEAGWTILRRSSMVDWRGVTMRAVAEEAGVNERTVYRHFESERGLRDAVMARLEHRAGIDLDAMELDSVLDVATRIIDAVAAFPARARRPLDPTLSAADRRQRDALVRAVSQRAPEWSDGEVAAAAAALDVLWNVASLDRLTGAWGMDRAGVLRTLGWAIGLVRDAVEAGRRPSG